MARASKRRLSKRTPSTSPSSDEQEHDQNPYANSSTARVNLYMPSDATPARGYRFSTLRVPSSSSSSTAAAQSATGAGDAEPMIKEEDEDEDDESRSDREKRERNERAARRRSRRSDAPSPTDEEYTPPAMIMRRSVKRGAKKVDGDGDGGAADASSAAAASKRRRPDMIKIEEPEDRDVVADYETPAPKRARRGAGKAETMSATTATGRALADATAGPFVTMSDSESTVSASDCEEVGAHKDDRRRRSAIARQEEEGQVITSSASGAQFDTSATFYRPPQLADGYYDKLLRLNEDIVDAAVNNNNIHANNHSSSGSRLPPLGTISTRRAAAFEDLPPPQSTSATSSPSPLPPPLPNTNNTNDKSPSIRDILDALAAHKPPRLLSAYDLAAASDDDDDDDDADKQQSSSPSPSSPSPISSSTIRAASMSPPQLFNNQPDSSGCLAATQKGSNDKKKRAKDLEVLYEGRGMRRAVSDQGGAQGGLEFGKPPTPRKSKARTRIATMPAELMSKVQMAQGGAPVAAGKKGGDGGEVDK